MVRNKFKKQQNFLKDFVYNEHSKSCSKQTITGLFRSIVEPILRADMQGALVLMRIFDTKEFTGLLKRLEFSSSTVFSFSDATEFFPNIERENIWESTEFIMITSPRYSVMMIWDYELSEVENFSQVYFLLNSSIVNETMANILDNSMVDFSEFLTMYNPERRKNLDMNKVISSIIEYVDKVNHEIILTEAEKENLESQDQLFEQYEKNYENTRLISHEIKNQLSVIDLYSKIIEKRVLSIQDLEVRESLANAANVINKSMNSIGHCLLELKNKKNVKFEDINVNMLIDDVIDMAKVRAEKQNTDISFDYNEEVIVLADKIKLQNVVLNVIYNALDAIQENGEIKIEVIKDKGYFAKINITDNGSGINEAIKERIFELDFTTKPKGQGLGLFICKKDMQEQYGDIEILKTDASGTTFQISIPVK